MQLTLLGWGVLLTAAAFVVFLVYWAVRKLLQPE